IPLAPFISWFLTGFGRETPIVRSHHYTNMELLLGSRTHLGSTPEAQRIAERQFLDCFDAPYDKFQATCPPYSARKSFQNFLKLLPRMGVALSWMEALICVCRLL